MRSIRIPALAFLVASCAAPQDPADPVVPVSSLETSSVSVATSPQFVITMPTPYDRYDVPIAWVGSRTLFKWKQFAHTGVPAQVRWIVLSASEFGDDFLATLQHIETHPNDPRWSAWVDYLPQHDQGTSWYSPFLADGRHVFALQSRTRRMIDDELDPDRNVRFLGVNRYQDHGPVVRLSGTFLDPIETTGSHPLVITSLPGGTPIQYAWTADASHLGTAIASYRYGWDILDYEDDSMWNVPFTPYDGSCRSSLPRTYFFGTHTFTLEVHDVEGNAARAEIKINAENAESFFGALDIIPGQCENTLHANSEGRFTAVLASTIDFDVLNVDASTIQLEGVTPVATSIADVVTAEAPNFCECLETTPDGRPDLVLTFETDAVVAALALELHSDSRRMVWCEGQMDHPVWGRQGFYTKSCVAVEATPNGPKECLPADEDFPARDEGTDAMMAD